MKILLTAGVVVAVLVGAAKFRKRKDADLWQEVTAR